VSLVVFPFKDEPPALISQNIEIALRHDRVEEVWGIAEPDTGIAQDLRDSASRYSTYHSKPVALLEQERIGDLRPGKGDAMNTAIQRAAEQDRERVHFYDADITNFDAGWIEGAERAADRGYGVVRHRFPRAATDAMITWFITRPGLAMFFPGTILPRLDQPLGGEFLVTTPALHALAASADVRARSDWGIDTMVTYETATLGLGLYEHHVTDGKRHALYGSLADLETMAVECLDAVRSLHGRPPPLLNAKHASDSATPAPQDLKEMVAFDADGTAAILETPLTADETDIAGRLPIPLEQAAADEEAWGATLAHLLQEFRLDLPQWRALAFRLWVARVLAYTREVVPRGYDGAMSYLEGTIRGYETAGQSADR
jgi:hypothetical protein